MYHKVLAVLGTSAVEATFFAMRNDRNADARPLSLPEGDLQKLRNKEPKTREVSPGALNRLRERIERGRLQAEADAVLERLLCSSATDLVRAEEGSHDE